MLYEKVSLESVFRADVQCFGDMLLKIFSLQVFRRNLALKKNEYKPKINMKPTCSGDKIKFT